jgi:hypothetical protein
VYNRTVNSGWQDLKHLIQFSVIMIDGSREWCRDAQFGRLQFRYPGETVALPWVKNKGIDKTERNDIVTNSKKSTFKHRAETFHGFHYFWEI